MPCPSEDAAGKPCSGADPSPPHLKSQESHPDRSYQLWHGPGLGDTSRHSSALPCSQRLTVSRAGKISFPGELPHQKSFTFSHSSCVPSLPAGSALSPAPGQSCLSAALPACHELPPSQEPSSDQQQRTSPRHFNDPSEGRFGPSTSDTERKLKNLSRSPSQMQTPKFLGVLTGPTEDHY